MHLWSLLAAGQRAQVLCASHRDPVLQRPGGAGEALGRLAKLLWKLVLLIQPLEMFAF